jgi:hypothetical protein
MEQTSEKMDDTKVQINNLSSKIDGMKNNPDDSKEKQWYRDLIGNSAKYFFYILLILLSVSLGLKINEVFGLFK